MRKQLADLVAPVDPEDAEAVARVRRPLFRTILLWEFGDKFRLDPELPLLLDALEEAMGADVRMGERLVGLIRALRQ